VAVVPWYGDPHGKALDWSVILPPAMADRDTDTIHAVLAGDVDRYAELVDRYQAPALRLAFSLLGNYEDAKDASQEAFVNAYRALGRFRGRAKFSTWLYRIVVNKCKDLYKRRARRPELAGSMSLPGGDGEPVDFFEAVPDPGAGPGEQLANQELSRQLSRAIGELPMKQRTAFALHHVHGLPLDEVAAVMRCRTGTVKSHIFRATTRLRTVLSPRLAKERP